MSSTTHERKPSVSKNWFSSLRRQPKSKNNKNGDISAISNNGKGFQKSCVDLSTTSSDINDSHIIPNGLINYKKVDSDNVCTCSSSLSTNTNQSSKITPDSPITISKTETIQIDQLRNLNNYNLSVINNKLINDNYSSSSSSGLSDSCSTNSSNSSNSEHIRKDQFGVTTTTKITQTTVITKQTHRIGLIFNDNGEIITNLDKFRHFANFDKYRNEIIANHNNQMYNKCNNSDNNNNNSNLSILNNDFEYIDGFDGNQKSDVTSPALPPIQLTIKPCASCRNKNRSKSDWDINSKKQIKDELCEVVAEMQSLDSQEDSKHSNKDKQMSIGRKKFNMDPKKGIEYLCENHLLRMDAQDIAHFLYKGEGLNKTAIGDYLGEKNDFNERVLKAFVELHDFSNLILVQALRQFLWSFRLPGEAQKIDRMMECFAQRYCQLNPDIFTNTDTCYVLSFAIIMLNTSLHNPSVKDKPTLEQFISMNRGINNGGDLSRELLESLYESIRTEPFKIPQDDGNDLMHTFFNPDKEGWLLKQGGRYKSWKRRWFILNDNCLYYFEYTTDKEPRGIIPLENISVREIQDRSKPYCFELYASGGADIIKACKTDSEGKVVEGKHTVYRMSAATEEDKQEWIKCLTQSISHNPFYDILVQRKKKALAKS